MPAAKLLCQLVGIDPAALSREESLMLEHILFYQICFKLNEFYKSQYKDYFQIIKLSKEMENITMDTNFARCIINDIISTEEYSLSGVACYTQSPEDVILEIVTGRNTDPSATLLRRIIDLHQSVRPDLYQEIMTKIFSEHLVVNRSAQLKG
jgi:hypothetical protein